MSQSLSNIIVHIVFSTKDRFPFIDKNIRHKLHAYISTICRNQNAYTHRIGGVADHIHIATVLPRTKTVSKLVEVVKRDSSIWIKKQNCHYEKFYWQKGYSAFSVSHSQLEILIKYIENQEKHHRKLTFQDEYRKFLNKYKVEFDEKYIWD